MRVFNYKNINFFARKRTSLIKELQGAEPFINGSIVSMARVCGNKNCKCARGEKHVSSYFSYRDKRKKRTNLIYIPIGMVNEVKEWNAEHKRIKRIIGEICRIQRKIIRQYVKERKRPKK